MRTYSKEVKYLEADVLFIAAMIPPPVRIKILERARQNHIDPISGIIIRDARGLTAELLYPPVEVRTLSDHGFEVINESHLVSQILNGTVPYFDPERGQVVSAEIVNSTLGAINYNRIS
jgi:hypothetical protein